MTVGLMLSEEENEGLALDVLSFTTTPDVGRQRASVNPGYI